MKDQDDDSESNRIPQDECEPTERQCRPRWYTIEEAASLLRTSPVALRARCRRAKPNEWDIRELASGIRAFKFGRHWRIEFDRRP